MNTRFGLLEFRDGAPSITTVETLYENLDFLHGVNVFVNAFQGASTYALRQGFRSVGVEDNSVLIFSELMDSQSLFLTANADTVYYVGTINLSEGPMVLETPPMALGTIDDMWFRSGHRLRFAGPDRGAGGKLLLLPPGYEGDLPDSGFHVGRARTSRVLLLGRSFLTDNDPQPTVELIKQTLKIYPYTPGGYGTSIATLLEGKVRIGQSTPPPPTVFVEGSGLAFNTIPANDFRFYEQLNALVQEENGDALDPEIMGELAAIGIVKGKPFNPDARMKAILTESAAVGNAIGRAFNFRPRETDDWAYYPGSAWFNMLFQGGYTFETPPPLVTTEGIEPFPPTGARTLNSRTAFFYAYTGITPAMIMRLTNVGSQYLMAFHDADKHDFDGAKTYQVTLPAGIPENRFWSLTVYDNQTRSMLQTPQRYPRAGSQSYPTPAAVANADGSMTISFGPEAPAGNESNWIQTVPGKGWFAILRLYSPLQSFFDKSWQPSEIEAIS